MTSHTPMVSSLTRSPFPKIDSKLKERVHTIRFDHFWEKAYFFQLEYETLNI